MQRGWPALLLLLFIAQLASAGEFGAGSAVIREINRARHKPAVYANYLEELRAHFRGKFLILPGRVMLQTHEGIAAVNEAIRFLRGARPLAPLADSPGIAMAAADHVADQARGAFGHAGSDRSNPGERMNHHGTWRGTWGEDISYGQSNARQIVIALIVDDGLPGRKHRNNIFNPAFNFAGAAIGPHARYRTVCNIDFAAQYTEQTSTPRSLFARN